MSNASEPNDSTLFADVKRVLASDPDSSRTWSAIEIFRALKAQGFIGHKSDINRVLYTRAGNEVEMDGGVPPRWRLREPGTRTVTSTDSVPMVLVDLGTVPPDVYNWLKPYDRNGLVDAYYFCPAQALSSLNGSSGVIHAKYNNPGATTALMVSAVTDLILGDRVPYPDIIVCSKAKSWRSVDEVIAYYEDVGHFDNRIQPKIIHVEDWETLRCHID